mmetsp:Transcript_13251/g.23486  ORF Transcript_13251/g.23486 Transcript_13251/m.23486 type:complete len:248 (-) Transcript_13251:445-1188(-)|eukprot:CAMPEP_0175045722 /NCGR_PEP_ID=MMETSP0052_2-20121109/4604_1 /TAXON_ID=51329 ORGANISM="Polytomella parva, Strain SAG 63-3" /NCGR_SAMPLE_ID=MMETSP0052_2 /ASSEMBLY_ACC=CAM_ASM_000194 /LENGTH=247 /DNA_ID=CAMNT_0016309331 /DNA_START=143 /DNA_END=886 /DNA_ORIENTATION=+
MSDDWEDWEDNDVEENLAAKVQEAKLKVEAVEVKPVAVVSDLPDMSKFDDEKEEAAEVKKIIVPEKQPKKVEVKKYADKDKSYEEPLSDPAEERERQKRLQEEADLKDSIFGDMDSEKVSVLMMKIETLKDTDTFAAELVNLFVAKHNTSKHYPALVKNITKYLCEKLNSGDTHDVERSVSLIRTEKTRKEKEARDALKKPAKESINLNGMGRRRGAREDDYFEEAAEYADGDADVGGEYDEYDEFM